MQLQELGKELDNNLGEIYKCILINGPWGIGKSYYINEYVDKRSNIYKVSLFGIEDISEFKAAISYHFNSKVINGIGTKLKFDKASISFKGFNIPLPILKQNLKEKIEKKISKKDKAVLIIDDLERINKKIEMNNLLGIIEELNQIKKLNIIVIANESEIKEKEEYDNFKEKVIERIYYVNEFTPEAVKNISKEIKEKKIRNQIEKEYLNSNSQNLRTLIKSIKFLSQLFNNINVEDLSDNQLNKIIKCTLYLMKELNENANEFDAKRISEILVTKYWQKEEDKQELGALSILIYNYYQSNDKIDCQLIELSYRSKQIVESEKDLFYCSKEELIERANKFKTEVMKKYNENFDINSLEKELSKIDYYLSLIGLNNYYSNKDVEKAIDLYIDNIDVCKKEIYDYIKVMPEAYQSNFFKKYNDVINKKITKKFIDEYSSQLEEEIGKDIYKSSSIKKIYEIIQNDSLLKNIPTDSIKRLKSNNFYFPDVGGELTEEIWGVAHTICNAFEYVDKESTIRKNFIKMLDNQLGKGTMIGTYRINSLKNQYYLDFK